jgi:cellulose synthase/poly-beta-1,6-N-acetylglucosamine synthase-like glycosyltransferase
MVVEIIFWLLLAIILYSYVGYALVLVIITKFKKNIQQPMPDEWPRVTLFIAAYNEKDIIEAKLKNTQELDYPKDKLTQLWVTDGSDDGSHLLLKQKEGVVVLHNNDRKGKISAMNRGVKYVETPIIVFCDANTMLNTQAIKEAVKCFNDPNVGCVAGEKRIIASKLEKAVGAGEGFYWKYESRIKELESRIGSTIGAAGELFAIRTELYEEVETDTLLDDFVISLRIAQKGYTVKYAPNAIACETSSASMGDELKRKIRIAAGGIQTLFRLSSLLNVFKYRMLSFKYWSHKVLRWTLVPFAMMALFFINLYLICINQSSLYLTVFVLQAVGYLLALLGRIFNHKQTRFKILFAPYYLVIMNYAIVLGIIRYIKGKQSVNWEKAKRA